MNESWTGGSVTPSPFSGMSDENWEITAKIIDWEKNANRAETLMHNDIVVMQRVLFVSISKG